jgi:NADPH-dependent ferric siderophore reductase
MARFTLTHPGFADLGVEEPGEILTLGWSDPGERLHLPGLGWRFPAGVEQHWRNYTVRLVRPEAEEVDVDFFLHGPGGRASEWAEAAAEGDEIGFAGPRTHWVPDAEAAWTLLVADETGLPALLAILETLPAGHPVVAVAEIQDRDEVQPVDCRADLDLRWVVRGAAAPGTSPVLAGAVRDLELPDGPGQVWGGGEAMAMRAVRAHIRGSGVELAGMRVLGYWKHRTSPEDAYADDE